MIREKVRLGVLISGGASTAAAVLHACRTDKLPRAELAVVIANSMAAGAKLSAMPNPPIIIRIRRCDYQTPLEFDHALLQTLKSASVDLVLQLGWMVHTPDDVLDTFTVLNQHPGPLRPDHLDFGGKGMHGERVHCARLRFVRKVRRDFWTEAVTHIATSLADQGVVIKKRQVTIFFNDTCQTLKDRLLPVEHSVQIEAVRDFCENQMKEVVHESPLVRKPEEESILAQAKAEAIAHHP